MTPSKRSIAKLSVDKMEIEKSSNKMEIEN